MTIDHTAPVHVPPNSSSKDYVQVFKCRDCGSVSERLIANYKPCFVCGGTTAESYVARWHSAEYRTDVKFCWWRPYTWSRSRRYRTVGAWLRRDQFEESGAKVVDLLDYTPTPDCSDASDLYACVGARRHWLGWQIERAVKMNRKVLHPDYAQERHSLLTWLHFQAAADVLCDPPRRRLYDLYGVIVTAEQAEVTARKDVYSAYKKIVESAVSNAEALAMLESHSASEVLERIRNVLHTMYKEVLTKTARTVQDLRQQLKAAVRILEIVPNGSVLHNAAMVQYQELRSALIDNELSAYQLTQTKLVVDEEVALLLLAEKELRKEELRRMEDQVLTVYAVKNRRKGSSAYFYVGV